MLLVVSIVMIIVGFEGLYHCADEVKPENKSAQVLMGIGSLIVLGFGCYLMAKYLNVF